MATHLRDVLLLVLAFGAGFYASSNRAVAQEGLAAECIQVQQADSIIYDAAVAAWMTEQLDLGRTNFESITGLSTVLCAW